MLTAVSAIRNYFAKLDFEPEIADLYLALHAHGPQSISELSRNAQVERTRIYRLIDRLMESNLIEVEMQHRRGIIKAAPIANLRILIAQKAQDLKSLQDELEMLEQVLARNSLSDPASRVQFYPGLAGRKQMLWNEAQAKTEVLCITSRIDQPKTHTTFYNRWVAACNANEIHFREIHSDTFHETSKNWYAKSNNDHLRFYDARCISKALLAITHSVDIYDNVVAYYLWKDGEIFGIEMYNQDIANMQRRFFEILWTQATTEENSFLSRPKALKKPTK